MNLNYIYFNNKQYKVSKIGSGKFGIAYKINIKNKWFIAKTISSSSTQEVKVYEYLIKKNTCYLYIPKYLGLDDSKKYIIIEYIEGEHPHIFIHNKTKEAILNLSIGIALAYKAINNIGVLHRDIHSPNIIVTNKLIENKYPLVKIIDFGLSIIGDPMVNNWEGKFLNNDGWANEKTAAPEAHNVNSFLTTSSETYAVCAFIWRLFDEEYPFGVYKKGIPLIKQRLNRREMPENIKLLNLVDFFNKGLNNKIDKRFKTVSGIIKVLANI